MDKILAVGFICEAYKCLFLGILRKQTAYFGSCEVQSLASLRIQTHFNGFLPSSVDIDGSYPIYVLQIGTNILVYQTPDTVGSSRTTHLKHHEVIIHLSNIHFLYLYGKTGRQGGCDFIHLLLQFKTGHLEVDILFKVNLYAGLPPVNVGLQFVYSTYRTDRSFKWNNHFRLYIRRVHILL